MTVKQENGDVFLFMSLKVRVIQRNPVFLVLMVLYSV